MSKGICNFLDLQGVKACQDQILNTKIIFIGFLCLSLLSKLFQLYTCRANEIYFYRSLRLISRKRKWSLHLWVKRDLKLNDKYFIICYISKQFYRTCIKPYIIKKNIMRYVIREVQKFVHITKKKQIYLKEI